MPPRRTHRPAVEPRSGRALRATPDAGRKGIAKGLIAQFEAFARSQSRTLLVLDTQSGSVAEALYASLSWQRAGAIPGYAASPDGQLHAKAMYFKRLPSLSNASPRAMPAEIRAFFEQYRDAIDRLDGEAIACLYAVPSGIASEGGYTHWPAFEPIRDNMVALCKVYRDNGFASASSEPVTFLAQVEHFALADLSWNIERSADR